ncbi:hypothetical protein [Haloarcula amylovorans]|uniref:hypothetical protein n=1 Tax=Haloarcula amylovorans TaxID=2562280 RepID=UPI001075FAE8|nr:hypothetical protein [Halomicroarcula amylolytica]
MSDMFRSATKWSLQVVGVEVILAVTLFNRFAWQYSDISFGRLMTFIVLSILIAGILLLREIPNIMGSEIYTK